MKTFWFLPCQTVSSFPSWRLGFNNFISMPRESHSAGVNTSEYLFRGTGLISHVYYVFLIQGEISFLVCGRLYLTPFSFPESINGYVDFSLSIKESDIFNWKRKSLSLPAQYSTSQRRQVRPLHFTVSPGTVTSEALLSFSFQGAWHLRFLFSVCDHWFNIW